MARRSRKPTKPAKRLRVVVPPNDATPEELAKALLRVQASDGDDSKGQR
ncbi:MAG: hypothetical protein OXG79_04950 [Chloroflexi bacterium]|nr:hypothetical protein [Chloroflexota bacterium]